MCIRLYRNYNLALLYWEERKVRQHKKFANSRVNRQFTQTFSQQGQKVAPKQKTVPKICPRVKNLPKWQNFAQSSHTVCLNAKSIHLYQRTTIIFMLKWNNACPNFKDSGKKNVSKKIKFAAESKFSPVDKSFFLWPECEETIENGLASFFRVLNKL